MKTKWSAFGQELVVARLKIGVNSRREITATEIAKKLGVSPAFLSLLEKGKKHPSVEMLAKIIRAYPPGSAQRLREALKLEVSLNVGGKK